MTITEILNRTNTTRLAALPETVDRYHQGEDVTGCRCALGIWLADHWPLERYESIYADAYAGTVAVQRLPAINALNFPPAGLFVRLVTALDPTFVERHGGMLKVKEMVNRIIDINDYRSPHQALREVYAQFDGINLDREDV